MSQPDDTTTSRRGDGTSPVLGMNRRDFVRRSAVVGGTVIWAAPTIQSFASPAFAQSTEITGFSYFAAVVECTDTITNEVTLYRVKYEVDLATWECPAGSELPACESMTPSGWDSATPSAPANSGCADAGPFNIHISQSGTLVTFCVEATADHLVCDFTFNGGVHGVVKEAQNCTSGTLSNGDTCITFDESVTNP